MRWPQIRGMKQSLPHARRGMSLVELLVVVAILGILMALTFTAYLAAVRDVGSRALGHAVVVAEQMLPLNGSGELQVAADPPKTPPDGDYVPNHYFVRFDASVANPAAAAESLVAAFAGGKVLNVYDTPEIKGCNVDIPGITSDRLQGIAHVLGAEAEGRCHLTSDTIPTGVRRISATYDKARPVTVDPATLGLPDVQGTLVRAAPDKTVVAVIDTGIDGTHPDLNVTRSLGFGQPNGNDENGHGTHVSGTIGAKINNIGVVGVFPGVNLWSLRVLDRTGSGTYGNLANALTYVANNSSQISVCNLSLGGPYSQTINDLMNAAANRGVSMVVAAGNDAKDAAASSPASASKAICVAALADSDGLSGGRGGSTSYGADDSFATFSNFGATVDVIAPGVNILSTYPQNRYASMSGTSMATPHVSGLMGLYATSVITMSGGKPKSGRAAGLELVSLLLRYRGAEFIKGRFDQRQYPLMIGP